MDVHSAATQAEEAGLFELSPEAFDALPFCAITLDRKGTILRYNRAEEALARRHSLRTVGLSFFSDIAPCTNVHAFRGRFDEFARRDDTAIERFTFSFAFRWGRQDVFVTLLRKSGCADINLVMRLRSGAGAPHARPPAGAPIRQSSAFALRAFADPKPWGCPVVLGLHAADAAEAAVLRGRVNPDDVARVSAAVAAAARASTAYAVEYRGVNGAEGRVFHEHGSFGGARGTSYATIIDVTEERQGEADLWCAAYYDLLTGLPNRQLLLARIADAIAEAETNGRIAALLVVNITHFRAVNDTVGYDAGNEILRGFGLRLGEAVRSGDTVARIGGDGFAVLMTDLDTPQSVAERATGVISAVAQPLMVEGHPHYLKTRVGVSLAPDDSRDATRLLNAAETANFAAKKTGAGGMRFYSTQLTIDAVSQLERQNELRAALENDEFVLVYQPVVDIRTSAVIAVEALVRWNHPKRGLIMPLDFIPLADSTGLIVPLGGWVLRTACRQARAWMTMGLTLRVCVNVSTVQFMRPDFVELVTSIIAECEIPAGLLELEVTESIMIQGFDEMMDTLTRLKATGLRIAIDDFGTGYSSLSYLKYFPVDTVKVDRAFIIDIASDTFDHAITTAIFVLTENLGLDCVIEGVETVEQLETLRKIGCSIVQGYYFFKPSGPDELSAILLACGARAGGVAALST